MAEKPIIFSAPMVRAILEGRKTMTRRILKPQPDKMNGNHPLYDGFGSYANGGKWCKIPYAVGDRLWVREAWRTSHKFGNDSPRVIAWQAEEAGYKETWAPLIYEADGHKTNWAHDDKPGKLRSPIHMPRWASRITLAVTAVKVERVQDISEDDAKAEGVCPDYPVGPNETCRMAFRELWNSIHGKDAWDRNDWVVVISFERVA